MKELINERLDQLIPPKGRLFEAARYSLLAPGKRIRPILLLTTLRCYDTPLEKGIDVACALEMIHTYSLIHDDLPAMDDDVLRRGMPTLHIAYDEATAILAGDYLLTRAFEVIAQCAYLEPEIRLNILSYLAHAAGGDGMVGGQMHDLQGSLATVEMLAMKTGALFRTALECGAMIAKASDFKSLQAFGSSFGLLFQLVDDLQDHDHPDGERIAISRAEKAYNEAIDILRRLPVDVKPLEALLESLHEKICLAS